jgi:hypothetical protein
MTPGLDSDHIATVGARKEETLGIFDVSIIFEKKQIKNDIEEIHILSNGLTVDECVGEETKMKLQRIKVKMMGILRKAQ